MHSNSSVVTMAMQERQGLQAGILPDQLACLRAGPGRLKGEVSGSGRDCESQSTSLFPQLGQVV